MYRIVIIYMHPIHLHSSTVLASFHLADLAAELLDGSPSLYHFERASVSRCYNTTDLRLQELPQMSNSKCTLGEIDTPSSLRRCSRLIRFLRRPRSSRSAKQLKRSRFDRIEKMLYARSRLCYHDNSVRQLPSVCTNSTRARGKTH